MEGTATIGYLGVEGTTNIGSLGMEGTTNIGSLGVDGTTNIGSLGVEGTTNIGSLSVEGTATIGSLGLEGTNNIGSLGVESTATIGFLGVEGTNNIGSLGVEGTTNIGSLGVEGTATIGSLGVEGTTTIGSLGVEGNTEIGSVGVEGVAKPNKCCGCNEIDSWGSDQWCSKEGIDFWANFQTFLGYRGCATAYKVCSSQYRYLRTCLTERECAMCKCKQSNETNTWKLIGNLDATNPVQYETFLNMIDDDVSSHHWLCSECYCLLCHESFCDSLEDEHNDPIVQCRNRIMKELITSITNDGITIIQYLYISKFKHSLSLIDNIDEYFNKYVTQCKRLIDSVLVKGKFSSYSNFPNPGVIILWHFYF